MSRPDGISAAFNEAGDRLTAWREQQWELMSENQQKAYERIEREHRQRQRDRADQFYKEREKLVQRETTRLLLSRPELTLRLLPGRLKERRAAYVAARNVQGRHEDDMKTMTAEKMKALDGYMKDMEVERSKGEEGLKGRFSEAIRGIAMQKERDRGRGRERER